MTIEIVLDNYIPVYPDMCLHRITHTYTKVQGRGAYLKEAQCSEEASLPTLAMSFYLCSMLVESGATYSFRCVDHSPER